MGNCAANHRRLSVIATCHGSCRVGTRRLSPSHNPSPLAQGRHATRVSALDLASGRHGVARRHSQVTSLLAPQEIGRRLTSARRRTVEWSRTPSTGPMQNVLGRRVGTLGGRNSSTVGARSPSQVTRCSPRVCSDTQDSRAGTRGDTESRPVGLRGPCRLRAQRSRKVTALTRGYPRPSGLLS